MSHKRVCPIMLAAPQNPNFKCIEWECAWWCEKENECAVLVTAEILKDGNT